MLESLRRILAPLLLGIRRALFGPELVQHDTNPETIASGPRARELCLAAILIPPLWQSPAAWRTGKHIRHEPDHEHAVCHAVGSRFQFPALQLHQ